MASMISSRSVPPPLSLVASLLALGAMNGFIGSMAAMSVRPCGAGAFPQPAFPPPALFLTTWQFDFGVAAWEGARQISENKQTKP